jgi:hypothetical protein
LALLRDVLLVRDSYVEANGGYGDICTYCGNNPLSWSSEDRVIDFVLVRNSPSLALVSAKSEVNLQGEPYDPLSDHYGVKSEFKWEDREATYLSVNDPIVQARMKKAADTVDIIGSILAEREEGSPTAQRFWEMGESLRRGELPPVLTHFLVP